MVDWDVASKNVQNPNLNSPCLGDKGTSSTGETSTDCQWFSTTEQWSWSAQISEFRDN